MKSKASIKRILHTLDALYPFDGVCFLNYENEKPWQLLFATILSAQCTDARVNMVTPDLFAKFPTLESYTTANIADIEKVIHSTGFYRSKAKSLQETAQKLLSEHSGNLPSDITELTALPGVGRKTANVVRSHIFNQPSIVVDTHVKRITKKLGLTESTDPVKIEFELMELLPKKHWIPYNQQIISHGRAVCTAQSPKCDKCKLKPECREGLSR